MNGIYKLSRRSFIKSAAVTGGGLVLGIKLAARPGHAAMPKPDETLAPNVFVAIAGDGMVTIIAHRSEMGTGIRTSLPMVVADELEADWSRVLIEQAPGDKKYGSQYTDGSRSMVQNYQRMREFGATARTLLEQAAAHRWGVDPAECHGRNHQVVHKPSGRSADYGELVATAARLPLPSKDQLRLKDPKDFRYIGKDMAIVDLPDIVQGTAIYGIDIRVPNMKYAVVARCPVVLGKVKSYDASRALKVPGVTKVIEIPAVTKPVGFKALGGIAVVADNTWAAIEGRNKLAIQWEYGPNAGYDSPAYRKQLEQTAQRPGDIARKEGDVESALSQADKVVEALYYVPHFSHAQMEPPAAVAHVHDDLCEVWSSTQDVQGARTTVAAAIGFKEAQVTSRVPLLGGAFGRKSKPDFAAEAAIISKAVGAPIKVTWTREDDIQHGYYHSVSAQYLKAGLDAGGNAIAWHHRTVFPPIESTFTADATKPAGWELDFGFTDLPYAIPNIQLESGRAPAHVRIGWLRSVQNLFHAFATNSFANELAVAAGRDPLDYQLALIGPPRQVDLAAGGVKDYFNYDSSLETYPIDTGRLAHVLKLVAEKAGYGRRLPQREGIGLAVHRSFLSYVATAVHVQVAKDGKLTIPRVDMAVDAGRVINPDRVRAQMEGATLYGMSAALLDEITARDGEIQQRNYNDYPVVMMGNAPHRIHVHLVASNAPPGGVGEPGTPPFAPALCNAIYAATGKRIRSLPIKHHDLSA